MAGCPAVQHHDWGALPGKLDMNLYAVVGHEMRHDDQLAVSVRAV